MSLNDTCGWGYSQESNRSKLLSWRAFRSRGSDIVVSVLGRQGICQNTRTERSTMPRTQFPGSSLSASRILFASMNISTWSSASLEDLRINSWRWKRSNNKWWHWTGLFWDLEVLWNGLNSSPYGQTLFWGTIHNDCFPHAWLRLYRDCFSLAKSADTPSSLRSFEAISRYILPPYLDELLPS